MDIFNLTQHSATDAQKQAGVIDLTGELKEELLGYLNFTGVPSVQDVRDSAKGLADIMMKLDPDLTGEVSFMVGGAPYLMAALAEYSPIHKMVFACSDRVSEEIHLDDGSVRKVNVFKHLGFVAMNVIDF